MTKEERAELRAECDRYASQPGFVGMAVERKVLLALLDALDSAEAERVDEWKPFFFGESTPIREGQTYLFTGPDMEGGWFQFSDAIVWDEETPAQWRDGSHGLSFEDVSHYRNPPAPPEKKP